MNPATSVNGDQSGLKKLDLFPSCHNQDVEQHVKLVTEASMSVAGHEKRDDLIRQRIRSRKLIKCF